MAVALADGGEFAFVLFSLAAGAGLLPRETAELLVLVVTLSMAAFAGAERRSRPACATVASAEAPPPTTGSSPRSRAC